MNDTPKPRRRWLRYSLITLLVLGAIATIAMTWIAHRLQQAMHRHEAVEAILKTGARLRFNFEIDESGNRLPEASLPGPTWLQYWMGDDLGANVVEADVQTDTALEGIKDLPQLHTLHLRSNGITDAGLEHLEQMPQLKAVYLEETQVTDEGVRKLQKALPNCRIIR